MKQDSILCVFDEVSDGALELLNRLSDAADRAQRRRAIRGHEHILGLLLPIPGERARARRIEELLAA